jgi:8-oxo-dGTP pyrophosphatase MutT (NUDIX family)
MWSARGSAFSKRLRGSGMSERVPTKASSVTREISAGGVVVRQISGIWYLALIEPQKIEPQKEEPQKEILAPTKTPRKRSRALLALPKGLVDPGEKPQAAAVREVREETGVVAEPIIKIADNKYVYVRKWSDGKRVFKIVSFYLMRYVAGEIDDLASEMRIEVKRALWVPLDDAPRHLMYSNERKVVRQAQEHLETRGISAPE